MLLIPNNYTIMNNLDFKQSPLASFLSSYRSIGAIIGKGIIAAPLVALIYSIGPPWPSRTAVPILTSLIELVVIIYVLQFASPLTTKRKKLYMNVSMIALGVGFISYCLLFNFFVFDAPDSDNRDIKGFLYTSSAQLLMGEVYPTDEDALKSAAFNPLRVYVPWTVYMMRTLILLAWGVIFSALAMYIGLYLLLRAKVDTKVSTKESAH